MKPFATILKYYGKLELAVAMIAFSLSIGIVIAQVLARQAGLSFWWGQETAQLAIMYAYFLGVSHLYQVRHMVVVEFMFVRFPPRMRRIVYRLGLVSVIFFCLLVLHGVFKVYRLEMRFPSFVIQVPRFYWTLPLGIASVSMIATSTYFLIASMLPRAWEGAEGDVDAFETKFTFAKAQHDY